MQMRKMMAVVLTVALALMLALTGCGRKPAANVLLNMLNGQYKNVTVTTDKDLENTLRRAVKENRTPEQTAQALEKTLGTTVSFDGLRSARAGDQTFDLVFQTGSDTEAIARQTYTDWNTVFSTLPSGGQYLADLAAVQADNGYYILVNVTIKKGGSSSSDDDDDKKEDEEEETPDAVQHNGYVDNGDGTYTVNEEDGLKNLFDEHQNDDFEGKKIILDDGTYTLTKPVTTTEFNGTLTVAEGADVAIQLQGTNMFETIGDKGTIQDIVFEVTESMSEYNGDIGWVAVTNEGDITGCTIEIMSGHYIQGSGYVGGVVAENAGTIQYTKVIMGGYEGGTDGTAGRVEGSKTDSYVGGIAGLNAATGTIHHCEVRGRGDVSSTIGHAGIIAGCNEAIRDKINNNHFDWEKKTVSSDGTAIGIAVNSYFVNQPIGNQVGETTTP